MVTILSISGFLPLLCYSALCALKRGPIRPRFLYKFFLITPPVCISLHTSSFVRPLQPLALRDFQRYYAFSFATVFSAVSFCRVRPFSHCVPLQNSICLHLCRCEQKNPKHKPRTFLSPPVFPHSAKARFPILP